jgi:hypothetical protein
VDNRYIRTSRAVGETKILDKSYLENLVADAAWVTQEFASFKEVNRFQANAQCYCGSISKGFLTEITIQDFPLKGKFVYLHIKR